MQKETTNLNESVIDAVSTECEAQIITSSADAEISSDSQIQNSSQDDSQNGSTSEEKTAADFENLIKGPYKDAFAKKVQSIINKRFKEQKMAEQKSTTESKSGENITPNTKTETYPKKEANFDSTYESLIEAGVDPETAYRVLHIDEIMDSSMRYGAELAAKQLADNIRQKASRPFESALSQKGYSAKVTASTLTPQKRKELAKKALMGEHIGF